VWQCGSESDVPSYSYSSPSSSSSSSSTQNSVLLNCSGLISIYVVYFIPYSSTLVMDADFLNLSSSIRSVWSRQVTRPSFCYNSIYSTPVVHFLSVPDRIKYIPWFLSALPFLWPVSKSLPHSKDQSSLRHSTHFIEFKWLPLVLCQAKNRSILLHIFGETVPCVCVCVFLGHDWSDVMTQVAEVLKLFSTENKGHYVCS
jgi:hypothetical protein